MKRLLFALLSLNFSFASWGQVYFENNYDRTVFVAIGYYANSTNFQGYITKGWYKIPSGETKKILGYNPENQYLYYYATTEGSKKKFEGSYLMLMHPSDKFQIWDADKSETKTTYPSYQWAKFNQIDKGNWDFLKLKYTIKFYG
jgi:uncharacterized membrane protein